MKRLIVEVGILLYNKWSERHNSCTKNCQRWLRNPSKNLLKYSLCYYVIIIRQATDNVVLWIIKIYPYYNAFFVWIIFSQRACSCLPMHQETNWPHIGHGNNGQNLCCLSSFKRLRNVKLPKKATVFRDVHILQNLLKNDIKVTHK